MFVLAFSLYWKIMQKGVWSLRYHIDSGIIWYGALLAAFVWIWLRLVRLGWSGDEKSKKIATNFFWKGLHNISKSALTSNKMIHHIGWSVGFSDTSYVYITHKNRVFTVVCRFSASKRKLKLKSKRIQIQITTQSLRRPFCLVICHKPHKNNKSGLFHEKFVMKTTSKFWPNFCVQSHFDFVFSPM